MVTAVLVGLGVVATVWLFFPRLVGEEKTCLEAAGRLGVVGIAEFDVVVMEW